MIQILDNIFNDKDIDTFYGEFRDFTSWEWDGGANNKNTWRKFSKILDPQNQIHSKLFKKSDEIFYANFPQYKESHILMANYASGYLFGTHHDIHSDYPVQGQGITVMFYLNKVWDISYGGETIFVDSNFDISNSVIPKPGRAIVFDGTIPHCAREVSRTCIEMRMVVTFKYELASLYETK